MISKCLFGVFTFFQKTNENKSTSSKVEFVSSFFGRNVGLKKSFRICLTFISYTILFQYIISEVPKSKKNLGKYRFFFSFLQRRYSNMYGFDPQTNNFWPIQCIPPCYFARHNVENEEFAREFKNTQMSRPLTYSYIHIFFSL